MPHLREAIAVLRRGGVIAYPTEYCFGLGCDPLNEAAVRRILTIKQRAESQGLILIAASVDQAKNYSRISESANEQQILASWPGPNTWILPATKKTPAWIKGAHPSVALRVSNHPQVQRLCNGFNGALVSTSANRHGQPALLSTEQVEAELGAEVDLVVAGVLSNSNPTQSASAIYHGETGEQIR